MKHILTTLGHVSIVLAICFLGLAIHYWLGWPDWLRRYGSVVFVCATVAIWFLPVRGRSIRRIGVVSCLMVLAVAYFSKSPIDQNWVPLHARHVTAAIDGDIVRLDNFRDAIHRRSEPAISRWQQTTFDLSKLQTADLILQPFGNLKAMEHAMMSFGFSDGRRVVVSIEARRTSWDKFDALSGFFRHDQIYPIIGSERDLVWKRLAREPPFEMQFYPLAREPEAIRSYFERVLAFANAVADRPQFYNTIRESCLTTLIRLAPETFAEVPWYDFRQWIPGYSISLFQDVGLVDDGLPADELARQQTLRSGIQNPWDFADDRAWSAYLRQPSAN
jgi:hypothetical protein